MNRTLNTWLLGTLSSTWGNHRFLRNCQQNRAPEPGMRPPIAPTGPASSPWDVLLAATWIPSLEARLQGASIHLSGQTWQILLYLGSCFWSWRQRSRQANSPQPGSNLRPANVPDFLPSTTQGSIILTTRQKGGLENQ